MAAWPRCSSAGISDGLGAGSNGHTMLIVLLSGFCLLSSRVRPPTERKEHKQAPSWQPDSCQQHRPDERAGMHLDTCSIHDKREHTHQTDAYACDDEDITLRRSMCLLGGRMLWLMLHR